MIFEGSEKKFELITNSFNLRDLGFDFFNELVRKSNAEILQVLSNNVCDAYLLSESSLFIWKDRMLMITCGKTALKDSLLFIIEKLGPDKVDSVIFQRKNEYFAKMQDSHFYQDIEEFEKILDGNSLRFGVDHEHHNLIFSLNKKKQFNEKDKTYEILSYDICEKVSAFFVKNHLTIEEIRDFFQVEKILEGFEISDYIFRPFGYSLNALRREEYCTVHVTPQVSNSYVSFETNMNVDVNTIIDYLVNLLRPSSLDIISFNLFGELNHPQDYIKRCHYQGYLKCGYLVDFQHLYKKNDVILSPITIC